jgi:hypothetical protein
MFETPIFIYDMPGIYFYKQRERFLTVEAQKPTIEIIVCFA